MNDYTTFLPSYSVGKDCYKEIPYVTRNYGNKAIVIGGKTAMSKAKPFLIEGIKDSDIKISDFVFFGGDSSYENVNKLLENPDVLAADMLFGVGGGRACDTVKILAHKLDKPFFTFPTLASNCASCTAIAVVYDDKGAFKEYYYMDEPSFHTFINTQIIADSPKELLWAGIGDALSKECEVVFASREKPMYHTPLMGKTIALMCTDPLIEYGKQALTDISEKKDSFALSQVALDIIMTTGIVSNFATHENQKDPNDNYYYNSSLAHCVYYGSSLIKACENHLHGEIVALGVLVLLEYDQQLEQAKRIRSFNHSIGLPITFDEIDIKESDFETIGNKATSVVEWNYVPNQASKERFIKAMEVVNQKGKAFLNPSH